MATYIRPQLTEEEQKKVGMMAARLNAQSKPDLFLTLIALIGENAILTKEVQEHRAARGIDPLPVYESGV